jgi:hypothetical protein
VEAESGAAPAGAEVGAELRVVVAPAPDAPAAPDEPAPADGARATGFLERAVLRRRLRFLRRRRELALHDLGGFVFEEHRLGRGEDALREQKLAALDALDGEIATLEHALGAREELTVLREPGIAACPECRTLHDSAARHCPGCGRPTAAGAP